MKKFVVFLMLCMSVVCNAQNARELGKEYVKFSTEFYLGAAEQLYNEIKPVVKAFAEASTEAAERRKQEHIAVFPSTCIEYEHAIDSLSQQYTTAKAAYDAAYSIYTDLDIKTDQAKEAIPASRTLFNRSRYDQAVAEYIDLKNARHDAYEKAHPDVSCDLYRSLCDAERALKTKKSSYEQFLKEEFEDYGLSK